MNGRFPDIVRTRFLHGELMSPRASQKKKTESEEVFPFMSLAVLTCSAMHAHAHFRGLGHRGDGMRDHFS